MFCLENEAVSVSIQEMGGCLTSIYDKKQQREYMWERAMPNLFPIVGRLAEKRYLLHERTYNMKMHGFLQEQLLTETARSESSLTLQLRENPQTLEVYPFPFCLTIRYTLEEKTVHLEFTVENTGTETLYYALGGHPAFRVPLEKDLCFEDYCIVFPTACEPEVVSFSSGVLTLPKREPFPLEDGRILRLRRSLFARDAVVLTATPGRLRIVSDKSCHGVEVEYGDMPYVGIWQFNKGEPDFICIEPWSALPGREGVIEDLTSMPGLTRVEPGGSRTLSWAVRVW